MWGQEKKAGTSSSEQEGKEVVMVASNSTNTEGAGDISAFVGKGVEFKGTISYSGTVRIDGYVKLRTPAVMNGSIKSPILSMEDGVLFNGALEMAHGVRELPHDATLQPVGMIAPPGMKRVNG